MIPEDMPSLSDSEYAISPDTPDAFEQMMIELINRARMDPLAEAARQGTSLGDGVSADPSQPLAPIPELDRSSSLHSFNMIDRDFFAHTDPDTGKSPFDRMRDQGYSYWRAGENIGIIWTNASPFTQSRIEAHHDNLWDSLSHRVNMMDGRFTEVGVGYDTGTYVTGGNSYGGTSVITENFGLRNDLYLTGVIIDDLDGDGFYDIGEGQGGVRITAYNDLVAVGTTTWDAGGYSLRLGPGTYTVVFDEGDLDGHYVTTVTIADRNVKLDVVEGRDAIADTAPGGQTLVTGSAGRDRLEGSGADEIFISGAGRTDRIFTGGGEDVIIFRDETSNGRRERTVIYDFDPDLDVIALADGVDVADHYTTRRGHLVIEIGDDGDQVLIRDAIAFDDLTILNGTSDFLA